MGDSSGHGEHGNHLGSHMDHVGKYGNALAFNGTNALVTINDSASLHLTTGMTLEAWVNPTATSDNWRDVIYKPVDNYFLEATSYTGPPGGGGTFGGNTPDTRGTTAITARVVPHPQLTYDNAMLRLYVNGTRVLTLAQTGSLATSTNPLQIGGDSVFGQYFAGIIDEIRIYNVALTAAQIQSDMNADTQAPTAPTNLSATAVMALARST